MKFTTHPVYMLFIMFVIMPINTYLMIEVSFIVGFALILLQMPHAVDVFIRAHKTNN